ncbi:MAG: pyridoxal-phosphate dependent enzyme [Ignavibacteria bacterium]|nr:pyridoxal-phosphate dependent enzyme [Ignavibacteria bacterium]
MSIPGKILLAQVPTPLQEIKFGGKSFLIKRDDLTGCELSGNKIRKLEYILEDAKRKRADIIFTCGGDQSNHARATTIAAKKIGLNTKLFLWGKESKHANGNLFLNKMFGAEIKYLNKDEFDNVNEIMFDERMSLLKKKKNAYVLPEGGSTTIGIWGYIQFIDELKKQVNIKTINSIVSAGGSGGTAAGMLVGAALNKLNIKIVAVNVLYSQEVIKKKILQLAEGCVLDYKLNCKINPDKLIILDGYSKEGYKSITKSKVKLIKKFAAETGILFDPVYTGKAFNAYYDKYLKKGIGKKNIFVHTGGLFAVFGRTIEYLS